MGEESKNFRNGLQDLVEEKITVSNPKALKLAISKDLKKVAKSTSENGANQPDYVNVVDKTKAPESVQQIGDDD